MVSADDEAGHIQQSQETGDDAGQPVGVIGGGRVDEIAAAVAPSGTPFVKISDRAKAIRYAVTILRPGDLLVLAGKGHETYQLVGSEKQPFSEREILLSAVHSLSKELI